MSKNKRIIIHENDSVSYIEGSENVTLTRYEGEKTSTVPVKRRVDVDKVTVKRRGKEISVLENGREIAKTRRGD